MKGITTHIWMNSKYPKEQSNAHIFLPLCLYTHIIENIIFTASQDTFESPKLKQATKQYQSATLLSLFLVLCCIVCSQSGHKFVLCTFGAYLVPTPTHPLSTDHSLWWTWSLCSAFFLTHACAPKARTRACSVLARIPPCWLEGNTHFISSCDLVSSQWTRQLLLCLIVGTQGLCSASGPAPALLHICKPGNTPQR